MNFIAGFYKLQRNIFIHEKHEEVRNNHTKRSFVIFLLPEIGGIIVGLVIFDWDLINGQVQVHLRISIGFPK